MKRKCTKFVQKSYISGHFDQCSSPQPTQKPFTLPVKYIQGLIFSQKTPQISTTSRKCTNFLVCGKDMSKLYPKNVNLIILTLFHPPNLLKSHLYYQWSTSNCLQSPISLHQLVLPKMYSFLTFTAWKCTKCAQKLYIWSFWPTLEPYNPLKSSLHSSEVHLRAHIHPKDSTN